jgi:hypothetical protein
MMSVIRKLCENEALKIYVGRIIYPVLFHGLSWNLKTVIFSFKEVSVYSSPQLLTFLLSDKNQKQAVFGDFPLK